MMRVGRGENKGTTNLPKWEGVLKDVVGEELAGWYYRVNWQGSRFSHLDKTYLIAQETPGKQNSLCTVLSLLP